jgi:hypothetical protein
MVMEQQQQQHISKSICHLLFVCEYSDFNNLLLLSLARSSSDSGHFSFFRLCTKRKSMYSCCLFFFLFLAIRLCLSSFFFLLLFLYYLHKNISFCCFTIHTIFLNVDQNNKLFTFQIISFFYFFNY